MTDIMDGPPEDDSENPDDDLGEYVAAMGNSLFTVVDSSSIVPYSPVLDYNDLSNGYITRYFLRQINNPSATITEVEQSVFAHYRDEPIPFYINLSLRWSVLDRRQGISNSTRGTRDTSNSNEEDDETEVSNDSSSREWVRGTNLAVVENADRELPGMKNKLTDLLELYSA